MALGLTVASYTPSSHSNVQLTHTSPHCSGGNKEWGLLKEGQPWRNTPVTFEHSAKAIEPRHCLPPCCLATLHPRSDCVCVCVCVRPLVHALCATREIYMKATAAHETNASAVSLASRFAAK